MKNSKLIAVLIVIIILLGAAVVWLSDKANKAEPLPQPTVSTITSFEECAAAGNPVMESFPRKCNANGETFTEVIAGVTDMDDMIRVSSPAINSKIKSPLVIKGEARGNWFFEASFPVILTNWDGLIIAEGYATAEGEWMTTDFVPFTSTITFTKPSYGERGFLILKKDNPSGLPEHDAAIEIPVFFE